jgi:hypothetical protein
MAVSFIGGGNRITQRKPLTCPRLICTILLYVCVLDTIYDLVTKKIAVRNLRKIIVNPKEDNLFLYIII